jgi:hypothetical protein
MRPAPSPVGELARRLGGKLVADLRRCRAIGKAGSALDPRSLWGRKLSGSKDTGLPQGGA